MDAAFIAAACADVIARHPDLDVVIAMAGIMRAEDWTHPDGFVSSAEQIVTTNVLGPIRLGTELHATLLAYLEQGGNVNAAARVLNMHRNTMLSKLDRISRTIGLDIREPENQFTVWLAVRLELLDNLGVSVAREVNFV